MAVAIKETSTITAKGQTTIPKAVRQALGVGLGDRIAFRIDAAGVSVHRADEADEADPVLERFLAFLAADMSRRPKALSALTPALSRRLAALTKGVDADLDAPIEGKVALR
jgi:antitoxin PrlF